MKTIQHTPGPWKRTRRIAGGYTIKGKDFWPAVVLGDGPKNSGTAIANARLIAAAPKLLEALRGLVNCHTGAEWQTVEAQRQWWIAANKAIAEAEGRG